MVARIVSLVVVLPAAVIGHILLFWGAGQVLTAGPVVRFDDPSIVVAVAVTLAGAVLIAGCLLTTAWSSLGAMVVGIPLTLVGGAALFAVFGLGDGPDPLTDALIAIRDVEESFGTGALFALVAGIALVTGVLFLAVALLARSRRRAEPLLGPAPARLVSVVVALLGLVPGVLLVLVGGYQNYSAQLVRLQGELDLGALGLIAAGLLVTLLVVLGIRWSSLGVGLVGLLVAAAGVTLFVAPSLLRSAVGDLEAPMLRDIVVAVTDLGLTGYIALIGFLLFFGAIAARIAGRVGDRRDSWVDPRTGPVSIATGPYGVIPPQPEPVRYGETVYPSERPPSAV